MFTERQVRLIEESRRRGGPPPPLPQLERADLTGETGSLLPDVATIEESVYADLRGGAVAVNDVADQFYGAVSSHLAATGRSTSASAMKEGIYRFAHALKQEPHIANGPATVYMDYVLRYSRRCVRSSLEDLNSLGIDTGQRRPEHTGAVVIHPFKRAGGEQAVVVGALGEALLIISEPGRPLAGGLITATNGPSVTVYDHLSRGARFLAASSNLGTRVQGSPMTNENYEAVLGQPTAADAKGVLEFLTCSGQTHDAAAAIVYLNPQEEVERSGSRRRKLVTGVVGTLAAGGLFYGAYTGLTHPSSDEHPAKSVSPQFHMPSGRLVDKPPTLPGHR